MNKITHYWIIEEESLTELEDHVNQEIRENGWQPFGSVFSRIVEGESSEWWFQPMVKYALSSPEQTK